MLFVHIYIALPLLLLIDSLSVLLLQDIDTPLIIGVAGTFFYIVD